VLGDSGVTKDAVYAALQTVRGGQRITDPNPEEKYQAPAAVQPRPHRFGPEGQTRSRSSGGTRRSAGSFKSCPPDENNPVLIGEPGSARPPSSRASRSGSSAATSRVAEREAGGRARPRCPRGGDEIPGRIRGSAEGVAQGSHRGGGSRHSVHRRAAHPRGRRRGRGGGGRQQHAKAGPGPG